jgi:membrane protease YdiL (CAAX protease family)
MISKENMKKSIIKKIPFKYEIGLCILLLLLAHIGYFINFIVFELFTISYNSMAAQITDIIIHASVFCVVIGVGLKDQEQTLASVCFFKKVNGKVWCAAIMCAIGYTLFGYYFHFLFYSFKYGWSTELNKTNGRFLYNLINTALIPAVAEEILYKGLIFSFLKKRHSVITAVIITSLMFAVIHLSLLRIIPLFLLSCYTFWIYLRSGSLIIPMLAHFTNNLFTFVLINEPFDYLGTFYAGLALLIIGSYMLYMFSKTEEKPHKITKSR